MSILGVIVRARNVDAARLRGDFARMPGVEVGLDPGDGRLILVIEDVGGSSAAASMAEIAQWPGVLNTSLVYEYSGPEAQANDTAGVGFSSWRDGLSVTDRPA